MRYFMLINVAWLRLSTPVLEQPLDEDAPVPDALAAACVDAADGIYYALSLDKMAWLMPALLVNDN